MAMQSDQFIACGIFIRAAVFFTLNFRIVGGFRGILMTDLTSRPGQTAHYYCKIGDSPQPLNYPF
jgi:hypothetical protein